MIDMINTESIKTHNEPTSYTTKLKLSIHSVGACRLIKNQDIKADQLQRTIVIGENAEHKNFQQQNNLDLF